MKYIYWQVSSNSVYEGIKVGLLIKDEKDEVLFMQEQIFRFDKRIKKQYIIDFFYDMAKNKGVNVTMKELYNSFLR